MERRKLNLDAEPVQQELPLANPPLERRRLALDDVQEVKLRVTSKVAQAVKANPEGAAAHLEAELLRMLEYTGWSRERPPSSGWWDIKQRSARELEPGARYLRWWYSAGLNAWCAGIPQRNSKDAQFVPHQTFMLSHEWRGMRLPWLEGYSYELERAPFAADITLGSDVQAVEVTGAAKGEPKLVRADDVPRYPDLNPNKGTPRRRIEL